MPRTTALDSPYEGLSIGASTWLWGEHREHVAYLVKDIEAAAAGKERNLSRFFAITKYTLKARFFNHIIGPFMDLERVFRAGLGMPNHTGSAFTDEERKAYKAIEKQIPELTRTMEGLVRAGASHFVKLVSWMNDAMHKARSDDVTRINTIVSEAAVPNPKRDGRIKGITTATPKTARGFNHPDFARLLCPMKYVEEFDADPNLFMQKVKGGEIEIFANDFPVFCYPFGHKYNPDDIEDGLCRCELLQRCMNATLTGPSTTFGDDRASKNQSVAFKHGYFDVVPEDVAYHVVVIRSALSDATSFGPMHKTFNNVKFFRHFANLLGDGDRRSLATLRYITESLPHLGRGPKSLPTLQRENSGGGEDPIALIRRQRQQKDALEARQAGGATPDDGAVEVDDMYTDDPNTPFQGDQHEGSSSPTPQHHGQALQDRTNHVASRFLQGSRAQSLDSQDDEAEDGDPMELFEKAVTDMLEENEDLVERALFDEFERRGEESVSDIVMTKAIDLAKRYMQKHEGISVTHTARKTVQAMLEYYAEKKKSSLFSASNPPRFVPAVWSSTTASSPAAIKNTKKTVPTKRAAESLASPAGFAFKTPAPVLRFGGDNGVQEDMPSAKRHKQRRTPSVSASVPIGGSQTRPRRSCSSKYPK